MKYENFDKNISLIKKKLKLKKEKVKIRDINFKKLKIKKKIKIDNNDKNLILKNASRLFRENKYSKKLPLKFR